MSRTRALLPIAGLASLLALALSQTQLPAQTTVPLSVEKIFGHGPLIGHLPDDIEWSPDGKHLSYLDGGELVDLDPGSGEPHVMISSSKIKSLQGAAPASEQDRDHRSRYGMAAYQWAPDSKHLLFDSNGRLWIYDLRNGTGVEIASTGQASGDDPKFSPNGEYISFIRNHSLAVVRLKEAGTPTSVVAPAPNEVTLNGEVDWVYEEELDVRSNYFWSPDSRSIAYLQMDEAKVPQYPITDWIPTHATIDNQRYPQPGDPNPAVRVGIVSTKGGKTKFIEVPFSPNNDYIPRFGWVDANTIYLEVLTRDQQHLNLYFADIHSGKTRLVYTDTDSKYLDFSSDLHILPHGRFLLTSWRDGHTHLYLYSFDEHNPLAADAALIHQLTQGNYEVEDVENIDDKSQTVFFTSNEGSPLQNNLWSIKLDGTAKQKLTTGEGFHYTLISPDGAHFTDLYSNSTTPPVASLCAIVATANAQSCSVIWHSKPTVAATGVTHTVVTVTAADGVTKL
jgi:dipeptidyl-peptidase 4